MSPEYGSRLQLQKIAMLDVADVVVVNKSDRPGARAAMIEVGQRTRSKEGGPRIVSACAKQHRDPGVDELFALLTGGASAAAPAPPAKPKKAIPQRT